MLAMYSLSKTRAQNSTSISVIIRLVVNQSESDLMQHRSFTALCRMNAYMVSFWSGPCYT